MSEPRQLANSHDMQYSDKTREIIFAFSHKGTLRPDLIESASALASGKADAIKTHHNDTEVVRALREKVNL